MPGTAIQTPVSSERNFAGGRDSKGHADERSTMSEQRGPQPALGDSARWQARGMDERYPELSTTTPSTTRGPGLPIGSVVSLVGGLALVAAFFMPWFAIQGLLLSGDFLARFLGNPSQLRQFAPQLAGNPSELQLLRGVVYLFPIAGLVAAPLALLGGLLPRRSLWLDLALGASGLIPLVALLGGVTRLPPGSALEVGMWTLGVGAAAIAAGPWLDRALTRRTPD